MNNITIHSPEYFRTLHAWKKRDRSNCAKLLLITPVIVIINVVYRALKILSFYHFWESKNGFYRLSERCLSLGKDCLRIAMAPIALVGLWFAALYGLYRPHLGLECYGKIEKAEYDALQFGRCIQFSQSSPSPVGELAPASPDEMGIQSIVGCPIEEARVHVLGDRHNDIGMKQNRTRYIDRFAKDGDILLVEGAPSMVQVDRQICSESMKIRTDLQVYPWDDYEAWLKQKGNLELIVHDIHLFLNFCSILPGLTANELQERIKNVGDAEQILSEQYEQIKKRLETVDSRLSEKFKNVYESLDKMQPPSFKEKARDESLIQTIRRFMEFYPEKRIFLVAGELHLKNTQEQIEKLASSCVVKFKETDQKSYSPLQYLSKVTDFKNEIQYPKPLSAPFTFEQCDAKLDEWNQVIDRFKKKAEDILSEVHSIKKLDPIERHIASLKFDAPVSLRTSVTQVLYSASGAARRSQSSLKLALTYSDAGKIQEYWKPIQQIKATFPSLSPDLDAGNFHKVKRYLNRLMKENEARVKTLQRTLLAAG